MTDLRDIAAQIESIGRNCEFGLIQRQKFELEPISLLRWAGSADLTKLAMAFDERFSRLGDQMTGKADPPGHPPEDQHWWLIDQIYDIVFHTDDRVSEISAEASADRARPRLRRLAEKLIEDLAVDQRIFLYSHAELFLPDDCDELIRAVRKIGPATLLLVYPNAGLAGNVVAYPGADNVLIGYVRELTDLGAANGFQWDYWPQMLTRAYELWSAQRPA